MAMKRVGARMRTDTFFYTASNNHCPIKTRTCNNSRVKAIDGLGEGSEAFTRPYLTPPFIV
jgi:hypothetical protein